MKKYTIGLIRVLTLNNEELLNLHGRLIEKAFPELRVVSKCIEDQPHGIYDQQSEEIAKPKILRLAKEFEEMGVDAVIISCAADPAVKEARREIHVPVIGAGSAVASLALTQGRKVGVLNLTEETPEVIKEILGGNLVAEEHPKGVRNTLNLMTEEGKAAAIEAAKRLKEKGAEVIALGCTGMSTIKIAPVLEDAVGIPVIDPELASGAVALYLLRSKDIWRELNEDKG